VSPKSPVAFGLERKGETWSGQAIKFTDVAIVSLFFVCLMDFYVCCMIDHQLILAVDLTTDNNFI
jgi:hypothetical protein